jgi:hypothetical protein
VSSTISDLPVLAAQRELSVGSGNVLGHVALALRVHEDAAEVPAVCVRVGEHDGGRLHPHRGAAGADAEADPAAVVSVRGREGAAAAQQVGRVAADHRGVVHEAAGREHDTAPRAHAAALVAARGDTPPRYRPRP